MEVNAGRKAIKANVKNPLEVPKQPLIPQYTEAFVPESPNLGGYTIGNRAQYRLWAMDILEGGARDKAGARLTAEKFWYDTYINSRMPRVINTQIANVFRRYK